MSAEVTRCPYCSEEIQATARKCKHCGEWLEDHEPTESGSSEFAFKAEATPPWRIGPYQVAAASIVVVLVVGAFAAYAMLSRPGNEANAAVSPAVSAEQSGVSRAEYMTEAQTACDDMFATIDALPNPQSIAAIEQDSESRGDAYQALVIDLRGIEPPEADTAAVDSWISAIEELVGLQQQAAHAAFSQDIDAYTRAVGDTTGQVSIARTRGSSLGLNCP